MTTIHTNAPEVQLLGRKAFPSYSGKQFKVTAFTGPMTLDSTWSGGSRDYWAIVQMNGAKRFQVPENGNPFLNGGKTFKCGRLPNGIALVRHTIFSGKDLGLEIYVNPENLNRLALPQPAEITLGQKIVLAYTRSRKSSYNGRNRAEMALDESGFPLDQWEEAKAECIAKGWLNKAGAITNEGRNVIQWTSPESLRVPGFKRFAWES